jgi:hypothetical protein
MKGLCHFALLFLCLWQICEAFAPKPALGSIGRLSLPRPILETHVANGRAQQWRSRRMKTGNLRASLVGFAFREVLHCSPLNPTWLIYKLQQALVGPIILQMLSVVGLSIIMIACGAFLFRYVFKLGPKLQLELLHQYRCCIPKIFNDMVDCPVARDSWWLQHSYKEVREICCRRLCV